ncbi:restriction endonuclease subunit S [Bacillus safensis]
MSKKKKTIEELLKEAVVSDEEQPYEVPENWVWTKLGCVFEPVKEQIQPTGNEKYIGLEHMNKGGGILEVGNTEGVKSKKVVFKKNDVLYGKLRPYLNKHAYVEFDGVASTDILVYRNKNIRANKLLNMYLGLPQVLQYANENSNGINLPRVSPKAMDNMFFPLPPFHEQKRIADKVEHLLSKIDEAKQLIEEAKETFELRREAILDKAFRGELTKKWREQNPNVESVFLLQKKIISELKDKSIEVINEKEIPATWKVVKMGEVVQVNPKKKKLEDVPEEQICTFIPMPAVSDKTGEIEAPEEREYSKVKKGYTFFEENDVLFAKITPCMENGKAAIAKNLKNGFGFGSTEFHVLRTSECINETYIHYFVRSKKFRLEAKRKMTGAVGQQRVPKEFLINYPLPLPPKEEQDVIVRTLSEIFSKDLFVEQSLHIESKLELIKQSILSKAFRGELGTNNPSEENSIESLKAILQEQVK